MRWKTLNPDISIYIGRKKYIVGLNIAEIMVKMKKKLRYKFKDQCLHKFVEFEERKFMTTVV